MPKRARRDKVEVYLHVLWTTWDRLPLIDASWEDELYALLCSQAHKKKCIPIVCNGMPDHVHLLLALHSTAPICELLKSLKGTSATMAMQRRDFFKWRPTYAAFSVSCWDVPTIKNYILNQKPHHLGGTTEDRFECCDEEYWFDDA